MGRGGTNGNQFGGGAGGGGSGFLEWINITFVGLTQLSLVLSNTVIEVFMEGNKDSLSAGQGQDGSNSAGRDGYSSGGCSRGDGGNNGSNGTSTSSSCRAGMGSGQQLVDIPLNHFTLT